MTSPVCVLAGGLGTRLGVAVQSTPKPLIEVAGRPFAVWQLELLARHGVNEVVMCVGYLGAMIEERLGAEQSGVRIRYSYDGPGLDGTLGAIRRARPLLGERFLVLYGDTYLRIDYEAVDRAWRRTGLLGLMTVLHNQGRWERSNVEFRDGRVVAYDKHDPSPSMEWIDYGLGGLSADALDGFGAGCDDLAGLYADLAASQELCGIEATERFYEIGTPASLGETDEFLRRLASQENSAA